MELKDNSCEPMDIDRSINSVNSDESLNKSASVPTIKEERSVPVLSSSLTKDRKSHVKSHQTKVSEVPPIFLKAEPKHRKVKKLYVNIQKPHHSRKQKPWAWYGPVSIIMIFIGITAYFFSNMRCLENIEIDKIQHTLTHKLFGQKNAITEIHEALKHQSNSNQIIFFYGGTGVGKTYAISLILDEIWEFSNVYHFTMPSYKDNFSTNLMIGLIMCKSTVMVIDGLTDDDVDITIETKEMINKIDNLSKRITIILIYNCDTVTADFQRKCDPNFITKLKEKFNDIKVSKKFVKFDRLTDKHLRQCIYEEIGALNISEMKMINILKNFNVSSDGCKGVHTKMKSINVF